MIWKIMFKQLKFTSIYYMVDDFTYDFPLQICQEVEGKQVKAKEKKIDYQRCEKCNVERMMYPHLGFYVCLSCVVYAAMIYVS